MLNTARHRLTMFQIIKDFFQTSWSHTIAFKGGTLAYFIYDLDRFSTDIDIDCIQGLPTEAQSQEIVSILQKYATIKDIQKFQYMHRYIVSYGNTDHNIKIELNARIRQSNKYEIINFFGTPIKGMEKSTMFANKLVAVMNRSTPTSRDLRDVYFFFQKQFPINSNVITERTSLDAKEFFTKLKLYILEHFKSQQIVDANLGMVLTDEQKRRAKKSLVQEIISYIDLLLFELR